MKAPLRKSKPVVLFLRNDLDNLQTINLFPEERNFDSLRPNFPTRKGVDTKPRKGYFKLKSLGISDNTSQTMDTKMRKGDDSSSSRVDKLSQKNKKRLFNFRFYRESNDSSANPTHLNSLKKTVKEIYDRSERRLHSRDWGRAKQNLSYTINHQRFY